MVNNAPDIENEQKDVSAKPTTIEVVHDADSEEYDPEEVKVSGSFEGSGVSEEVLLNSFENLTAPEFESPFYVRYRLLTISATLVTISWLIV